MFTQLSKSADVDASTVVDVNAKTIAALLTKETTPRLKSFPGSFGGVFTQFAPLTLHIW